MHFQNATIKWFKTVLNQKYNFSGIKKEAEVCAEMILQTTDH